jgi:hypothetical protein
LLVVEALEVHLLLRYNLALVELVVIENLQELLQVVTQ